MTICHGGAHRTRLGRETCQLRFDRDGQAPSQLTDSPNPLHDAVPTGDVLVHHSTHLRLANANQRFAHGEPPLRRMS